MPLLYPHIYMCIKVKLTKGGKEMALPRPSRNRPTDFLFWLQKKQKSTHKTDKIRVPAKPQKVGYSLIYLHNSP